MIFFLLLNILFFNIEIFSAEQSKSFLTPEGMIAEDRHGRIKSSLAFFAFKLAEEERSFIKGYRSLFSVFFGSIMYIGAASSIIDMSQLISAKPLLIESTPIIRKISIKITSASFIFMILSEILLTCFLERSIKRFQKNLDIVRSPETTNLWKTLFPIEGRELSKEDDKDFFNAMTSTEETEQKKINNRMQFFKKIIKINMLSQKTNQLDLTLEEKKNMNTKIANIIFYYPPQD